MNLMTPVSLDEATIADAAQAGRLCSRTLLAARPVAPASATAHAGEGEDLQLFESVAEALRAALALQRDGRHGIALHRGDCLAREGGVQPLDASAALVRELAAAAAPGQVLVSDAGFEALSNELPTDADWVPGLSWCLHGRYHLSQQVQDIGIVEVSTGQDPVSTPPPASDRLRRLPDEGLIPGWRAAVGQAVPLRPGWRLLRKLGSGGFGEAWLGEHAPSGERRAFKFCYHQSRLNSLKREVALFRLLQSGMGGEGFVPMLDWNLGSPPYFVESAYVAGGDLRQWCEARGGLASLAREQRLEIAAQMAESLAAAHAIGVLHKDIKPSNVLIEDGAEGPVVRLADFGVGAVTEQLRAEAAELTVAGGGNRSDLFGGTAMLGGTPMYMAPELFEGRPSSIHADAYALGVVLYQLAVGDFSRALGPDWQDDVDSQPLRSDIAALTARDPLQRRSDLATLAKDLRALAQREAQQLAAREAEARAQRARKLRRLLVPAFVLVSLLALVLAAMLQRISEEAERANREAATAKEVTDFFVGLFRVVDPNEARGEQVTVREVLDRGAARVDEELVGQPAVRVRLLNVMGEVYRQLGLYRDAVPMVERAIAVQRESNAEPRELAASLNRLASLHGDNGEFETGVETAESALQILDHGGLQQDVHFGDALSILGSLLNDIGDRERAGPVLERTLDWRERHLPPGDPSIAISLNNLGFHRLQTGDMGRALALFERSLAIRRTALGDAHSETAISWNNIAAIHRLRGDLGPAEEHTRNAATVFENSLGPDHPTTTVGWHNLGTIARLRGDDAGARAYLERSLAVRRASLPADHPWMAGSLMELASVLAALGEAEQAETLVREALDLRTARDGEGHRETALVHLRYADVLLDLGQPTRAAGHAARALAILRPQFEAASDDVSMRRDFATVLSTSGWTLALAGQWQEAEDQWREALAVIEGIEGQDRQGLVSRLRARLYAALGDETNAALWRQRMEAGGLRDARLDKLTATRATRP